MKVALVQTKQNELYSFHKREFNIPPEKAGRLQAEMTEQCFDIIRSASNQNCDLIVTTEAINFCGFESAPGAPCEPFIPLYPEAHFFAELSELARNAGSWLVVGGYHRRYDEEGKLHCYNSAFIYDRNGNLVDIYDKIHLAGAENDILTPGKRIVTVDTDMGRMGIAICYDMQFSDVCKGCKEAGAQFMAIPTWGWEHGYGMKRIKETGLAMAVAMAVPYWMPIEGERSPSELIDGAGRILTSANHFQQQLLIGEILLNESRGVCCG